MPNFKQTVKQCGKLIEDSELKDLLMPIWREIEWQGHTDDMATGAELDRAGNATIHLYPSLDRLPDATSRVLREFGQLVLLRAGARGTAIWQGKLDVPTSAQIALASQKLADTSLRGTCKTYVDVLDNYPDKASVDRLVYVNVVNALLANNISYPDSEGVDIMTWGPTAAYAKLEKYHCLTPLVSAYAPADIYREYGSALAAMVTDNLAQVRESSVAYALRGIVQRIARIASPA